MNKNISVGFFFLCMILVAFCVPAAMSADIVSHWKLDETTGTTAADSSGNGHTGTFNGTALVWMPTSGVSGGAIKFDASVSDSKAMRIYVPVSGLSASAGTVAFWTKLTEPQYRAGGRNGVACFFGCGSTSGSRINMLMSNSDTKLDIEIGAAAKSDIVTLSTAVWYHLAITWDGTNYRVYVNGSEQAAAAATISSLPTAAAIGNKGVNPAQSMDGMMDDVRVYAASLSAGEIYGLYGGSSDPSPADGAVNVTNTPVVSWTGGDGALSHDVYFGTVNPPPFKTNQTNTTYNPGILSFGRTYYWQVNEVLSGPAITGKVWSFTVADGKAFSPDPANAASLVGLDSVLNWNAGFAATSHDVYFGTANPPSFIGHQTSTLYNPSGGGLPRNWAGLAVIIQQWLLADCTADNWCSGADIDQDGIVDLTDYALFAGDWLSAAGGLNIGTTYYWCIDEYSQYGKVTGDIWSFTTAPPPGAATLIGPGNGSTDKFTSSHLKWDAGSYAASHDVYFGTVNPPPFVTSRTRTTFNPGMMAQNQTYYWHINEINAVGTSIGPVWSFTTGTVGIDKPAGYLYGWINDIQSSPSLLNGQPEGDDFVSVCCGQYHSIGLRSDGTIEIWGYNIGANANIPDGIQGRIIQIGAGYGQCIALLTDGTLRNWGWCESDKDSCSIGREPSSNNFIAVTAGGAHAVAVQNDGTLRAWGYDSQGQTSAVPTDGGYTAADCGNYHNVALQDPDGDGLGWAVCWGSNSHGQSSVPIEAQSGVIAVAGGSYHSMALRADGALVTWGMGGGFAPADNDYVAIANGGYSHIALKTDGTVTAWHAGNSYTQNPPENSGFIAVGGGYYQWYGIKGN